MLVAGPLLPYMCEDACRQLGLKDLFQRLVMSECCATIMRPTTVPGSIGDLVPNTQAKV